MKTILLVVGYFAVGFLMATVVGFVRGDDEDDDGYIGITIACFLAWPLVLMFLVIPYSAGELGRFVAAKWKARRPVPPTSGER